MASQHALCAVLACALPLLGCSSSDGDGTGFPSPVTVDLDAPPAERLSSYNLFTWSAEAGFAFNDRVVPYDLNTPLFSDYALKQRAIYVPDGEVATVAAGADDPLDFPVGSVLIKNFYFAPDLRQPDTAPQMIETRLMVRHPDGWHPLPYIWDEDQQDAVFSPGGDVRSIAFIGPDGASQTASYLIPARNQCQSCHARQDGEGAPIEIVLVGAKPRHLNRSYDYGDGIGEHNQLDRLGELGMLDDAARATAVPAAFDFRPIEAAGPASLGPAELEAAARSYLDINCAHCHNPRGVQGMTSQLFLNQDNTDVFRLGACKRPGSAGSGNGGLTFDIVPGNPDASILYFRTHTQLRGAMMPLLGRSVTHTRGAELLHAWIAAMQPNRCE